MMMKILILTQWEHGAIAQVKEDDGNDEKQNIKSQKEKGRKRIRKVREYIKIKEDKQEQMNILIFIYFKY